MNGSTGTPGGTDERPCVFFADGPEFGRWLAAHHDSRSELWMGLYKKGSGKGGITWAEAVREALCWGWIDSRAERVDDDARRQRWTPRKPGGNWSTVNIEAVAELTAQGRMQPTGRAAFARRREDRSGIYAYETRERELTPTYAALLAADPAASAFWGVATPGYRKIAVNWVLTAKQERTRDSRMALLVQDCAGGRMIPGQRYGTPPTWVARAAAAADEARGS